MKINRCNFISFIFLINTFLQSFSQDSLVLLSGRVVRGELNYEDSKLKQWIKNNSRGLVFFIIFAGVLFLADIANLIPKNP